MVNTRSSPKWAEIVTIRGRAEWLDVPRHQRFQRRPVAMKQSDRERTEAEPLTDLILTFSTPPNSGTPWYRIGRDPDGTTDIHIDCRYGISGCHLQLGFDTWGQVVVKDISSLGSVFTYEKTADVPRDYEARQTSRSIGDKNNPPRWVIPVGWMVSIRPGDIGGELSFTVPDHSDYIEQYQRNIVEFAAAQNNPISLLGGLALNSQRATTRGLFTEAQRVAREGKQGRYAWIISDKTLGEGTFGEVVEVFNTTNWCMCAGKRMKGETTFQHEAGVMKSLQHKHIVQYIDMEESKPTSLSMIIMEYYPLGDLRGQHKKRPFSEPEIIEIISQTAQALEYLHERRITHRDLKPANILVRSRQPVEIAVTDFGVAKTEESVMSTFIGTFQYMAPEVVSNHPDTADRYQYYTNMIDIWSLGMVAVEMLIGGLPASVSKQHDQSYASNVYKTRDKLLARCKNREFAALVREMLEWSHYDRPTAAACFERASSMVPVAQKAASASGHSENASHAKEKNPAEGVSSGMAATTVRVMKRAGSDMSTAKPPTKRPVGTNAVASSTKRDPDKELESMMLHELENELANESKQGGGSANRSAGGISRLSTPGDSVFHELGTAPPTKSSAPSEDT